MIHATCRIVTGLVLILITLNSSSSFAIQRSSKVFLCNGTDAELSVAYANNHFYKGVEYWEESGWYRLPRGGCEYIKELKVQRVVGFAFRAKIGEDFIDVSFSPKETTSAKSMGMPAMCVRPKVKFHYAQKKRNEIGSRCQYETAPLSFFVEDFRLNSDASKKVRIGLSGNILPENPNKISVQTKPETNDEKGRREFAEKLQHKFIIKAYSRLNREFRNIDPDKVDVQDMAISGLAEHQVIYTVMKE